MAAWMTWTVLVGGLLGGSAHLLESVLRARGRSARFLWGASLAVSVGLPVLALLGTTTVPVTTNPVAPTPRAGAMEVPAVLAAWSAGLPPAVPAIAERAEPWLIGSWLVASALLALGLGGGLLRLALRARRWPPARVGGRNVLLSDRFGPALVGVRAPRVVVPRWMLTLDPEKLRLVLVHEEEHCAAGDTRLLLAAALTVVIAPWNAALWWQLRRLRAAVELDCDARVLRRGAPRSTYGSLLLELGSLPPGPALPLSVATLSHPTTLLERRLKMIVRGTRRAGKVKTFAAVCSAALLAVLACETPSPTSVRPPGGGEAAPAATLAAEEVGGLVTKVGTDAPLVFLDGERHEGELRDFDPAEIDRVEIVKGAAAVAAFGPEAHPGVIQVFTKDAIRGELVGPPPSEPADTISMREIPADTIRMREIPADTIRLQGVPADTEVYVDGEVLERPMSAIDPDSIERIEVAKGVSGTVIHITMKKAAQGGGEE